MKLLDRITEQINEASNTNPYIRLMEKNKVKLDSIMGMNKRIEAIKTSIDKDVLPSTASQRFKDVRKKQIEDFNKMIKTHQNFKNNTNKTQKSIDDIYVEMVNFLKPYKNI